MKVLPSNKENLNNLAVPTVEVKNEKSPLSAQIDQQKLFYKPADRLYSLRDNTLPRKISTDKEDSFGTEKIEEQASKEDEGEESKSYQSVDKSSSEFDINKSVHTSQDHSSKNPSVSSERPRPESSGFRSIHRNVSPEAVKSVEKNRKTSASTKENKHGQRLNIHTVLNQGTNRPSNVSSPDLCNKSKRHSQGSASLSHTSKVAEKNLKEGNDQNAEI